MTASSFKINPNDKRAAVIAIALILFFWFLVKCDSKSMADQSMVDSKIVSTLTHQHTNTSTQLSPQRNCVVQTYLGEVGVREATGKNDGHDVDKYLASTNLGPGYAWCAAFVNWNLRQCGVITPQGAAWSPSWFPQNKIVSIHHLDGLKTFNQPPASKCEAPQPGDVFGIWFNNLNRVAHVGFWHEDKGSSVVTVEGNTNDAGSREGDGVYKKVRLKKQIYATSNWIDLC